MTNLEAKAIIDGNAVPVFPLQVSYRDWLTAIHMAEESLEKQIPKKPVLKNTKGIVGIDMWHCPVCKNEIVSDWNKGIANPYCHHCGQAIDWSEEE